MKKIQFPLRVYFTVDKLEGELSITSGRIKFNCNLEEYPELPTMRLVNKLALTPGEQSEILQILKKVLKSHMGVEDG